MALILISLAIIATAVSKNADSEPGATVIEEIIDASSRPHDKNNISGGLDLKEALSTRHPDKKSLNNEIFITNCKISGSVDFSDLIFNKTVDFNGTTFKGEVNLNGAIFKGKVNFNGATFERGIRLTNTTFLDAAFFKDARSSDDIILNETKYERLYLRWEAINSSTFDDSTYLALIIVLRQN
jgi:hypothetical protein